MSIDKQVIKNYNICGLKIFFSNKIESRQLPLALIVKNKRIKTTLYNFLFFYSMLGGLIVMFYPVDVFTTDVVINIQTMIHHMSMILIGFAIVFSGKIDFLWRGFLGSVIVFCSVVGVALIMNVIANCAKLGTFNMFFISPFQTSHLSIFSIIQAKAPYIVFLLSYIVAFSIGAFLIKLMLQGLSKIYDKKATLV